MHDTVDWVNLISIFLEIAGFIFILPSVIAYMPKFFSRQVHGSHRAKTEVEKSTLSLGIALVIVGLIGQAIATWFHS